LSKAAVSQAVTKLIARGILIEEGLFNNTPLGRKTKKVSVRHDLAYFVGTNLEGNTISACILDSHRRVITRVKRALCSHWSGGKIVSVWVDILRHMLVSSTIDPKMICCTGIGLPGFVSVDKCKTRAYLSPGKWVELNLGQIGENLNLPTLIANNVICRSEYEKKFGLAKDLNNFHYLLINYGMSLTTYINGEIDAYDGINAGEIGHLRMEFGGKRCICGRNGCLDCYVSGRTWEPQSFETEEEFDVELSKRAEYLAIALCNLCKVFYAPFVVLDGIYNNYEPIFKPHLVENIKKELSGLKIVFPEVIFAPPSDMKTSIGASQLAANKYIEEYCKENIFRLKKVTG
jgi:predicted NBD/HSP70 family sugar kinase